MPRRTTDRRGLLAGAAGALAAALAGCGGFEPSDGTDTSGPTTATDSPTPTATDSPTPTAEPTTANDSGPGADGSGAREANRTGGGTAERPPANRSDGAAPENRTRRSTNGSAPQNASNRSAPRNRSTNGSATRNASNRSAPQNGSGNATGDGTRTPRPRRVAIRVRYRGAWSGSVETDTGSRTVDGFGPETFRLNEAPSVLLVSVNKEENNRDRLTVEIRENGRVVESASTRQPGGGVRLTHSF